MLGRALLDVSWTFNLKLQWSFGRWLVEQWYWILTYIVSTLVYTTNLDKNHLRWLKIMSTDSTAKNNYLWHFKARFPIKPKPRPIWASFMFREKISFVDSTDFIMSLYYWLLCKMSIGYQFSNLNLFYFILFYQKLQQW